LKRLAIVAGAVVGILAVVLFVYLQSDDETEAPLTAEAPTSVEPAEQPAGAPGLPEAATIPPTFDIVRVERSGETVMAGRATPGAEVTVLDGDKVLGKVRANQSGEWVFLPPEPLAPGSHELGLSIAIPGGEAQSAATADPSGGSATGTLESEQVVVVVVPDPTGSSGDPAAGQADRAIAVLTPRGGKGVSKILQQPGDGGLADQDLVLYAVDYDENGAVVISGQATAGALIIVYLDNRVIGRVMTDSQGAWLVRPEAPVAPGLHSLRVDRLDARGKVIARVETPFSRSTVLTDLEDESFVVVQPGNSLWRIARRSYGEGPRYTVIYQANKSQIRDPDLIYPGQIFVVPPTD
jgi:hypothetical protein